MSKPIFEWKADLGAPRKLKPNVHQIKFGDGYELRVPTAINSKPRAWDVTFTRNANEAMPIVDFLDQRGGVEAFEWVDPFGKSGVFVCREWTAAQKMFGVYEVSATFEEVFEF